jgi:hypothetical protein
MLNSYKKSPVFRVIRLSLTVLTQVHPLTLLCVSYVTSAPLHSVYPRSILILPAPVFSKLLFP